MKFSWKRSSTTTAVPAEGAGSGPSDGGLPRRTTDSIYTPVSVNGKQSFPESIRAYNLKWEKLRHWLIEEYAAYEGFDLDKCQTGIQDKYVVWLPEKLTKEQKEQIDRLRDRDLYEVARQRNRDSHSPDPTR